MLRVIALTLALLALSARVSADVLVPDKSSQVVHLRESPGTGTTCGIMSFVLDHQVLSDGTIAPFAIPPNRVLVLTGVSWHLSGGAPGGMAKVLLTVSPDPNSSFLLFSTGALADAVGSSAGSALIPNAVVKPGPRLCYELSGGSAGVTVYGFLAEDK